MLGTYNNLSKKDRVGLDNKEEEKKTMIQKDDDKMDHIAIDD